MSEGWFERLLEEQKQLSDRINKLFVAIMNAKKEGKGDIGNVPLEIFEHQLHVMGAYNKDLILRIGIKTIAENEKNGSSQSS